MVSLKNQREIEIMAEGGKILWEILSELRQKACPGIATKEIDKEAERLIKAAGGRPSFKTVPNYHYSTCLCVNEAVVHGLPTDYRLKAGDILGIDVGLLYKGFHTDTAWTIMVGQGKEKGKLNFLEKGELALRRAIEAAREGNRLGNISWAIQETVEEAGYSVVKSLVGHGIGRKLHENPQIPGFLAGQVERTPLIKRGMTLAIEVIYNMGSNKVVYKDDGWTISTEDGQISGLFEKTIAVVGGKPIVLTE